MPDSALARWVPSPNYWTGRYGYEPLVIVCHGTDGQMPGSLDWLCNSQSGASVHYIVSVTGAIYQLVNEADSAWGNGIIEEGSTYMGKENPNFWSISVEHERWQGNTTPMTEQQVQASAHLVADIRSRHGMLPLIPHSAISPLSRAHCPGPNFPFTRIGSLTPTVAGRARTWVHFQGTPQRVPVVFYRTPAFDTPLYVSAAGPKTVLDFDAYCLGVPVLDPTANAIDRRWYHRHNEMGQQGWTPSAWIDGNAPGSLP